MGPPGDLPFPSPLHMRLGSKQSSQHHHLRIKIKYQKNNKSLLTCSPLVFCRYHNNPQFDSQQERQCRKLPACSYVSGNCSYNLPSFLILAVSQRLLTRPVQFSITLYTQRCPAILRTRSQGDPARHTLDPEVSCVHILGLRLNRILITPCDRLSHLAGLRRVTQYE